MNGAVKLGTILGIRIQVHWSFVLIIGWVLLTSLAGGQNLVGAITSVAFVLVLFGCVVLHELGHALAARMYGIPTRDITLLPIGGVARLERMPRKPSQELVVALAGPAVNVIIAGVLLAVLLPFYGVEGLIATATPTSGFLTQLLVVNVALVVFNLLPAFPMDGGRVLRALLAMFLNYASATRIAATVGQVFAFGFALLGFVNPFMFLIAAFIFFGAAAEAQSVQMREGLDGVLVRDAMLRQFRAVPAYARIRDVAMNLLDSSQQDYPVVVNGKPSGMLRRDDIIRSLSEGDRVALGDYSPRAPTDPYVRTLPHTVPQIMAWLRT